MANGVAKPKEKDGVVAKVVAGVPRVPKEKAGAARACEELVSGVGSVSSSQEL